MNYAALFNDSFDRVAGADAGGRLYAAFYERFLASDPLVVDAFANTDMEGQRAMLRESMAFVIGFSQTKDAGTYLESVARRHGSAHLGIDERLFDLWMDCLVATVGDLDPRFDSSVEIAWRSMLAPGLEFMKGRSANPG